MMRKEKTILVVDRNEARRFDLIIQLSIAGYEGTGVTTYAEARRELHGANIDGLVLSAQDDMAGEALEFAKEARPIASNAPLVLISDHPGVRTAAPALVASVISQSAPASNILIALQAAMCG